MSEPRPAPAQAVPFPDPRQQAVFRQPAHIDENHEEIIANALASDLTRVGVTELGQQEAVRRYRAYSYRSRQWHANSDQFGQMCASADGSADALREFHAVCVRMGVKCSAKDLRDRTTVQRLYQKSVKASEKARSSNLTGIFAWVVAVGIKTYLLMPLAENLLSPVSDSVDVPGLLIVLSLLLAAVLASGFTFLARFVTARLVGLKATERAQDLPTADSFLTRGIRIGYLVLAGVALVGAVIAYTFVDAVGLQLRLENSGGGLEGVTLWIALGINALFIGTLMSYELGNATKGLRMLEAETQRDHTELAESYRTASTRLKDEEDLAKLRTLVLSEEAYFNSLFAQLEALSVEDSRKRSGQYRKLVNMLYGTRGGRFALFSK